MIVHELRRQQGRLLELVARFIVLSRVPLALAGGDHTDFVSPSVAVWTLQLDPPRPGVGWDAAVFRSITPPPLAASDRVGHEVRGHALARAHQLLDGFGTAARSVCDVAGGTQLPTAQLRGTCVEEQDITVTLMISAQNKHFERTYCRLTASVLQLGLIPALVLVSLILFITS